MSREVDKQPKHIHIDRSVNYYYYWKDGWEIIMLENVL